MKKTNSDTYAALAFLVFCAFAWWRISLLPTGAGFEKSIGPEFFPGLMTAVIAALSAALLARSLFRGLRGSGASALAAGKVLARMGLFIGLLIVYILIYELLGFIVSSAIVLPAGMLLLGERRWLHVLVLPFAIIALGYIGFVKVMMVALPEFPRDLLF
jgi:putative tricarboxylic transport membrane protein